MKMKHLFWLFWVITLSGLSKAEISLAPSMSEVVRNVNDSYIVTCLESERRNVKWTKHAKHAKDNTEKVIGDRGHPQVLNMTKGVALVFERITSDDRGSYVCSSGGEGRGFRLIVTSPITFTNTPSEQTAQEHHSATIKCEVSGDPKPKILWKFYEKDLKPPKYTTTSEGLKIDNVTLEDRGTYTCRPYYVSQVTSTFQEKSIKLNVQHKPVHKTPVHAKVDQAYGYLGGEVNLTCEAVAEPAANFTWYRQHKKSVSGRIIQEPHWSILQLFIQNSSVFGDYLCKAQNKLGTLDQIINLQEGTKPPKPREIRLKGTNSDTLTFDIIGPDINNTETSSEMRPTGYRIQYRPKGHTKWDDVGVADFRLNDVEPYIITGLSHNAEYEIRAATRNKAGLSDFTSPIIVRTLQLQADQVTAKSMGYSIQVFSINQIFIWTISISLLLLKS